MNHLSPAGKEILAVATRIDNPTVDKIAAETTRPHELVEELAKSRLSKIHLDIHEKGQITVTSEGVDVANKSQFKTE